MIYEKNGTMILNETDGIFDYNIEAENVNHISSAVHPVDEERIYFFRKGL